MSLVQVRFATASKDVIDVATKSSQGVFSHAFSILIGLLLFRLILSIIGNYVNVHAASKFEIALKRRIFKVLSVRILFQYQKFILENF